MSWMLLRDASTVRVAVRVRGISRITSCGVLSSFSSLIRRSSVVLNTAKAPVCEGPAGHKKSRQVWRLFGLHGCNLSDGARSSHRQRAVVAKVPIAVGGEV